MPSRALHVVVTGDVKGFQSALASASKSTGAFAAKQKSISAKVTSAGSVMSKGITLPLVAAGVASVKLAADFEQQMSSLASVTDAPVAAMERLRKQALKAGADTKYSAQQAAVAQTELAKGGISTADILNGALNGALALAAAGELDLGEAASTTANALNLFGMQGKDAGKVADALATAANATTADVSDFGMALSQGGSAAALAGASFTETVAALEAMAKAGIKGSDAGTSLKSFFLKIGNPSKQAREAMHGLGLELFDAKGNLKSLPGVAENLRKSFGHLTKEQFLQKAGTIAGSDAVRALYALYKAGPSTIKGYEKGLTKSGTAAEVARKKQDNLKGHLEQLKGSLETLGIIVGTELIPPLTDLTEHLTSFANDAATAFRGLPKPAKTFALALLGVVAVAGPLLVVVGTLAGAIAAIATPAGAVVAGLALLAIAFGVLYVKSETFRGAVQAVVGWLADNGPKAFNAIKAAATAAFGWLAANGPKVFDAIKTAVEAVARTVGPTLVAGFNAAKTAIVTLAAAISQAAGPVFNSLKSTIATLGPLVAAVGQRFLDFVHIVTPVAQAIAQVIGPVLSTAFTVWLAAATRVIDAVGTLMQGVLGVIRGVVQLITGILTGDFGKAWQGVKSIFSGGVKLIVGALKLATAPLRAVIANLGRIISTGFKAGITLAVGVIKSGVKLAAAAFKAGTAPFRAAGAAIVSAAGAAISAGIGAVASAARAVGAAAVTAFLAYTAPARAAGHVIGSAVAAAVRALVGAAKSAGSAVGKAIVSAVRGLAGAARSAAAAVGHAVIGGFRSVIGSAFAIGQAITQGIINGIKSLAGAARDAAANLAKNALDGAKHFLHLGSPSKVTHQYGVWFSEGLANGITAGAAMARTAAASLGDGVLYELDKKIADAKQKVDELQATFDRADKQAEVNATRRRAGRKIQTVPKDRKGTKDDAARQKIIDRNKDIRTARDELRKLEQEAARANQVAGQQFLVDGLERTKAFNDAVADVRDSLGQMADSAASAFREAKQSAIDSGLHDALLALDDSVGAALERARRGIAADPRLGELSAIQGRAKASDQAAEDAQLAETMGNAQKKKATADEQARKAEEGLVRVQNSGSQRLIASAQRRIELAKAAQAAAAASIASVEADQRKLADQRRADELSAELENARAIAEDSAQAQKDGLDAEVAQFQTALQTKLDTEAASLAARTENYKTFAANVAAILAPLGLALPTSADQEAALNAPAPTQPGAAPGTKPKKKPKPKHKKKAIGGEVMARFGELTRINELGPEDVWLPRGARVTPASQSGHGGPLIGQVTINEANKLDEQAIAARLGFQLSTRRR